MSTRNQLGVLLDVAAFVTTESILFQLVRVPVFRASYLPIALMVVLAIVWGGPVMWIFSKTRFSLWTYFTFMSVLACLIAGFNYLAAFSK